MITIRDGLGHAGDLKEPTTPRISNCLDPLRPEKCRITASPAGHAVRDRTKAKCASVG